MIQIAKTTGFGYTRIIGELRKLGIKKISRQTVRNILKEEGIEPGPDRSTDTWENFIKRHGETLWAVDFFSVRSVSAKGFQHLYVLVFLCMKTREIIVSPSTQHPNSAWVKQQTEVFLNETAGRADKPAIIMHDRDAKFTKEFVSTLESRGVKPNALPKASPNLNGRCERVIQTLKLECLRKFLIFGQRHLDHLLREFTEYYNYVRSHTEWRYLPPIHSPPEEIPSLESDQIVVRSFVGGLVKSFERKAA